MNIEKIIKIPDLLLLILNLKLHGVSYAGKPRGRRVHIKNVGSISLGYDVSLNSYPSGLPFATCLRTNLKKSVINIGNHCVLNGTMIQCRERVEIRDYCMFGPGVRIVDNDSHRVSIDIEERRKSPSSSPIIIHKNVWVGMNSIILKGVEIGENSIVAAGSVVTKSVPENTLVAGNPAKIIKELVS